MGRREPAEQPARYYLGAIPHKLLQQNQQEDGSDRGDNHLGCQRAHGTLARVSVGSLMDMGSRCSKRAEQKSSQHQTQRSVPGVTSLCGSHPHPNTLEIHVFVPQSQVNVVDLGELLIYREANEPWIRSCVHVLRVRAYAGCKSPSLPEDSGITITRRALGDCTQPVFATTLSDRKVGR